MTGSMSLNTCPSAAITYENFVALFLSIPLNSKKVQASDHQQPWTISRVKRVHRRSGRRNRGCQHSFEMTMAASDILHIAVRAAARQHRVLNGTNVPSLPPRTPTTLLPQATVPHLAQTR